MCCLCFLLCSVICQVCSQHCTMLCKHDLPAQGVSHLPWAWAAQSGNTTLNEMPSDPAPVQFDQGDAGDDSHCPFAVVWPLKPTLGIKATCSGSLQFCRRNILH